MEDQELYSMTTLLEGFDQMDANAIVSGLNSPFIKSMDNEYTKIARNLQQKYSAKASDNPKTTEDGDDDEAGAML